MNRSFGLRQALILLVLLALTLVPRPVAGLQDRETARRHAAAGQALQAASAYARAARRLPWQPGLWELAGLSALAGGEPQVAIRDLARLVPAGLLSRLGWIGLGDAYQQIQDVPKAIWAWNQALHDFPPSAEVYTRLARQYRSLRAYPAAVGFLRRAVALEPEDPAPHYQLGLLLAAERPEAALPELLRAAQLEARLDPAVQSLRTALNIALNSDDRSYRFLYSGRALGALGEWDLAEEAFLNALAANPRYPEAWAWLAEARQQRGMDGGPEIQQALSLNPDLAMVQGLHGLYLQRQGRLQEALAAFLKAAAREPYDPGWQLALASLSEQSADLVAALDYLDRAVELAPDNAAAWRALASFSLRNSSDLTGSGLLAARRLVELAPQDWQSHDLAGQILMETGDTAGAEALLKRALELDPAQPAPALHLALLYLQAGDRPAAYSYLNRAWAFDPEGPYGQRAARLLQQYFP